MEYKKYKGKSWICKKFKFCNGDLHKFSLLLRKVVYLYEYIANCTKFEVTSLPVFSSYLNIEDISRPDYKHAKYLWISYETKIFRALAWPVYSK